MRRVLIGLVVLALAWGGYRWFSRVQERDARERRAELRLLQFDDRGVTAFSIESRGVRWRVERDPDHGGWVVREPVEDRGDPEAVAMLFGLLRLSPVVRTIEEPGPPAEYGLNPPIVRLALEGVDVPRVALGDVVPTRDGVFATVEGRPGVLVVQVLGDSLMLAADPSLLRERSLPGISLPLVRRITLSGPDGGVTLSREGRAWWISEPRRLPASDQAVTRLFEALEASNVQEFLDSASPRQPELGLGDSAIRIGLFDGQGTREIRLGSVLGEGRRAALRGDRPTPLVVPSEPLEQVGTSVSDYLARKLTRVNRYEVPRFRYASGGAVLEAVKGGDDEWTDASGTRLDEELVYSLLARVLEAPVRGWSPAPDGMPAVEALLEFTDGNGRSGSLRFFSDGTATRDDLPGVRFRCPGPPPAVPD